MRRLTCLAALSVAVLASCGGDEGSSGSPLDNALGYLPENAPIVISIDTDLEGKQAKAIEKIVKKFPFAGQIENSLKRQLDSANFNFDRDIRPLLGNPFVVGAADAESVVSDSEDQDFVGAIQAKSKDKLEEAVEKEGSKEIGEKDGAKLYAASDGDAYAVKDDVLIVAGSRKSLDAALARREADDRLTEETFDDATKDLPSDALVRIYGDLEALLAADPDTQDARKIKWVQSLRTFGQSITFSPDAIDLDFRLTTDSGELTDEDLPLGSGEESPPVIDRPGEIGAGLRDLGQVVRFAERAGQAVNPSGFGDYQTGKRTLEKQLDLDIDRDLIGQLEDAVSVSLDVSGGFGARAAVSDPKAFETTLAKLAKVLPEIVGGATGGPVKEVPPRDGLHELRPRTGRSVFYGVIDRALVVTSDRSRAAELGRESPEPVEGAKGALVFKADAEKLVQEVIGRQGLGLGGAIGGSLITGPLGQLSGSLSSSTDGLSGNFRLTFD